MIAGYGIHGQWEIFFQIFDQMAKIAIVMLNNVTFLSILSACRHAGLVEEGIEIFNMMSHEYQLGPESEHCGIWQDRIA